MYNKKELKILSIRMKKKEKWKEMESFCLGFS